MNIELVKKTEQDNDHEKIEKFKRVIEKYDGEIEYIISYVI